MFSVPRTFLVIFLALLQLLAPLVHAHAGEGLFAGDAGKLHVPGLEAYEGDDGLSAYDTGSMQYCGAKLDGAPDGIVVGVDAGIEQDQHDGIADADHDCFLPRQVMVFNARIALLDSAGPRSPPRLLSRYLFSPHAPRAPPVH